MENRIYIRGQDINKPRNRHIHAIYDASNLCTAVGGDQNKEFRGKTSIMWEGGIIIYIVIVQMKNDNKTQEYFLLARVCFTGRR